MRPGIRTQLKPQSDQIESTCYKLQFFIRNEQDLRRGNMKAVPVHVGCMHVNTAGQPDMSNEAIGLRRDRYHFADQ